MADPTLEDRISSLEAALEGVKSMLDGIAAGTGGAASASVASFVDRYEPMLEQLLKVSAAAAPDGHSAASILVEVGSKLLGLFHLSKPGSIGALPAQPAGAALIDAAPDPVKG